MSVISELEAVLTKLQEVVESALPDYEVYVYLRFPTENDRFPIALIVPTRVTPVSRDLRETIESTKIELELHLITKTEFDYSGTHLLTDLDLLLSTLSSLRFDTSKWSELNYDAGIEFGYAPISNWVLQSAIIYLTILREI